MLRRSFLTSIAAAALPAAAVNQHRKRRGSKLPPRTQGVVLYCHTAQQPKSWREVPSAGSIIGTERPLSLDLARRLAKAFNRRPASARLGEWAVVVVTDDRLSKGGVA